MSTNGVRKPKKKKPTPKWERISPAKAQELIEHSLEFSDEFRNRRLAQETVNFYRDEILAGRWSEYNGETIKVDSDGVVIDGQHRLWAIIESGKTIECLVLRGVARDDVATIDIGKKRHTTDFLRDHSYAATLSAALGWLNRYNERGMLSGTSRTRLSPRAAAELLEREPKIEDSLWVEGVVRNTVSMPSPLVFAHYCFARWRTREMADEFFRRLGDGVDLKAGSPIYVLRAKLVERKAARRKASPLDALAWTFKAMRLFAEGKTITFRNIAWRRLAKNPEDFPYLEQRATRKIVVPVPEKTPEMASKLAELLRRVRAAGRA